jgi:hypothetical protein
MLNNWAVRRKSAFRAGMHSSFGGSRDSSYIEQTARVEGRRRVRFEALENSDLSVRTMLSMLADELSVVVACK